MRLVRVHTGKRDVHVHDTVALDGETRERKGGKQRERERVGVRRREGGREKKKTKGKKIERQSLCSYRTTVGACASWNTNTGSTRESRRVCNRASGILQRVRTRTHHTLEANI